VTPYPGASTKNKTSDNTTMTRPINAVADSWIRAARLMPRNWMAANTVVTVIASGVRHAAVSGKRIATNSMMTTAFKARSAA
jgi:hypothetical protein